MKKVIEWNGEIYDSYASLFHDLAREGKTPCPYWDDNEYNPLEKYILTEVMKLEIKERPVR